MTLYRNSGLEGGGREGSLRGKDKEGCIVAVREETKILWQCDAG